MEGISLSCVRRHLEHGRLSFAPPTLLKIHDAQASEKWKKFKAAWTNYALAMELDKKPQAVQVATLLTVVGKDEREVYSTFSNWDAEGDEAKLDPVLAKFKQYCRSRRNVLFSFTALIIASKKPGKRTNNIVRCCVRWRKIVNLALSHRMKS